MSSSSKSPCAACKTLRRKCIDECVFAPYFPPDQPHRFQSVHSVYGASNVAKILSDIPTAAQRAEAVTTLVYEAEARLKDPVYGCVSSISILQHKLKKLQTDIQSAKQELATYIGPSAMRTVLNPGGASVDAQMVYPGGLLAGREQDMLRNLEEHQQQQIRQLYEAHQQMQFEQHQMQSMGMLMGSRRFDGAGPSGHSGSYDHIPQQELFHQLQQDQSSSHLQQPHPQHEQDPSR